MSYALPNPADEASEADRLWFEQHPGRTAFIRPFLDGELPLVMPSGDGVACTAVRQIRPGVRARVPVYLGRMPPGTEDAALRVLRAAVGDGA